MKMNFCKSNMKYLYYSFTILLIIVTSSVFNILNLMFDSYIIVVINVFKALFILYFLNKINKYAKFKGYITKEENVDLPIFRVIILYVLTIIPIVVVSGLCNWQIKILADLGTSFNNFDLYSQLIGLCFSISKCVAITYIIFGFQTFFENSISFENYKLNKCIPYGGICLLLTFGLLEFIFKIHDFNLLYLLFNLYFGIIYLISLKSRFKTAFLATIIYIF